MTDPHVRGVVEELRRQLQAKKNTDEQRRETRQLGAELTTNPDDPTIGTNIGTMYRKTRERKPNVKGFLIGQCLKFLFLHEHWNKAKPETGALFTIFQRAAKTFLSPQSYRVVAPLFFAYNAQLKR